MKNTTKMFIILILAFIVVLFSVINAQPIDVNFLVTKVSLPLAVILIAAVLVGALIVFIVMASSMWQKKRQIKELNQILYNKNSELEEGQATEVIALKEELRQKELELSDLKHRLVNDMMSDDTLKVNDWSDLIDEE
ncbi:LapA family protein [Vagococcus fluvialis]|uniref:LapA family protein n=1 Tax=Vagococcus fluvialis TaxID=2738 RepID=UPI001A8C5C93|nr:LapA family protein [Vagococcus fluvialis]MBO0437015.1 LapA family protein [Vagococcus fluvialis]